MIEKNRYEFEQYLKRNHPKMFMRPLSAIKNTDYGYKNINKYPNKKTKK